MSSTPNLVSQWDCSSSTNSGIFTLTGDCTISGNSDVFVITTLEITGDPYTKHLTTITAASNNRHFSVYNKGKLTLKYIKLTGGNTTSVGGSILLTGELRLYDSIIHENTAIYGGGGIYAGGKTRAVAGDAYSPTIIDIRDSVVSNNKAKYGGGGMYMWVVEATFKDSKFQQNKAINTDEPDDHSVGGGAMILFSSNITMERVSIANNIASHGGGGLLAASIYDDENETSYQANIKWTNVIIQNNKILTEETETWYGGGALYLEADINIIIRESLFISNLANNDRSHEIHSVRLKDRGGAPTISIINTCFKNSLNDNMFFEHGASNWKNCNSNLCKDYEEYNGKCSAADSENQELGIACTYRNGTDHSCLKNLDNFGGMLYVLISMLVVGCGVVGSIFIYLRHKKNKSRIVSTFQMPPTIEPTIEMVTPVDTSSSYVYATTISANTVNSMAVVQEEINVTLPVNALPGMVIHYPLSNGKTARLVVKEGQNGGDVVSLQGMIYS